MDKREQILSALADLSRTRGFYRVTVDELASRAGVSKRTIYRHFRSKDEIIEALVEQFMHTMAGKLEQIFNTGARPEEMLTGIISYLNHSDLIITNPPVLEDLRRHYPGLWNKIERFRADKIKNHFINILVQKSDAGGTFQVDPRILAAAFAASVQAVVNPEFILSNDLTFENTVKQLIGIFMYGIVKDFPGRAAE